MINLIIKGNMFDAFNAAHQRGIALLTAAQMFDDRPNEVVASCGAAYLNAVRSWFIESDGPAPYPAGALLFYSDKQSAAFNDERADKASVEARATARAQAMRSPDTVAFDAVERVAPPDWTYRRPADDVARRQRNTADAYAHKPEARPIGTDPVDVLNAIDRLKGW